VNPERPRRTPADTLSGPDREALRRALIRVGMDENQEFDQRGIDRIMKSTLLDSLASVRERELEDPSAYGELEILPYVERNNRGGYVDVGPSQGSLNINMLHPFAKQLGNPNFMLTEREWNTPPEEGFRNTVLHEGYHSMVPRSEEDRNSPFAGAAANAEETNARMFAAAFTALSSASQGETRKEILERAIDQYHNSTADFSSDWMYEGRGTRDDPRVRVMSTSYPEKQRMKDMLEDIAGAEVFADNPYNNPPSIVDRLLGLFSPKKEGSE